MNSDKMRAEIFRISAIEDQGEKAKAIFDLYHRFIDLIARNKVSMVSAACSTAREIKDLWEPLFDSGSKNEVNLTDKITIEIETAKAAAAAAAAKALGEKKDGQSS